MIHIYQGTKFVVSLLYDKNEFKPEWYSEWKPDMKVYETKFQYPIIDGETLREMTLEEKLLSGIIESVPGKKIVDGQVIDIPQPTRFHEWDSINKVWTGNIEKVRAWKRNELKETRELKQNADFKYQGDVYQAQVKDMRNIELIDNNLNIQLKLGIDIKPQLEQEISWTLKDNTRKTLKLKEVLLLYINWTKRYQEIHNYCNSVLYKQLEEAKTIEDILKINWV